jgi:hypothetical protein
MLNLYISWSQASSCLCAGAERQRYRAWDKAGEAISRWCVKHTVAAGYAPRDRGELELPASAVGEESVGGEGDHSHEHDRPE